MRILTETSIWGFSTAQKPTRCKKVKYFLFSSGSHLIMGIYCSYGYVTNTKIKFLIVVESANTALRENDVRGVRNGRKE